MPHPIPPWETRSVEELREQFEVERELASRLRAAPDRRGLYSAIYDEFLRRVPHYRDEQDRAGDLAAVVVALQLRLLEPFLRSRPRFLEVGGGGGALTVELSKRLPKVIAIEAGSSAIEAASSASNLQIVIADTPPYPLPDASVDLAFSSHTIEHLLPEDALLHLREMHRLLAPGGHYVCVTPNRLWGPHDVSRYFSDTAEGLHLREYTHRELLDLMRDAGFRRCRVVSRLGGDGSLGPHVAVTAAEAVLTALPAAIRDRLLELFSAGKKAPLRFLEQVMVVGTKINVDGRRLSP